MRIDVAIALLLISTSLCAETFYVRPNGSLTCQTTCAGASYDDAFNGFSDVAWGTSAGQVGPGDTLYVCGDFDRTIAGTTNLVDLSISGTASERITLDGSCPGGSQGRLWGARRIDTTAWTDAGSGAYSTPWTYTTEYAAEGAFGSETLLATVTSLAEVQATNGSIWRDTANNLLYYNPSGALATVWANWTSAIAAHGKDYYTFTNLVLRGGRSGEHGVIELTGNEGAGEAEGIIVSNSDIAFGINQLIECYDGCDGFQLLDSTLHDAPVGTYLCRGLVTCSGITMSGNEVYSGRDTANLYSATRADRHALGGQSITDSLFEHNYIHDWAGDGINIWVKANQYGRRNVIRNNLIERLTDTENDNYHRGIALNGSNEAGKGNYTSGWKIYNNVIRDLSGGLGTYDEGTAIRVKPQIADDGSSIEIFNNTISNNHVGIWLRENSLDPKLGGAIHNNAITAGSGHSFIVVDPSGDGSQIAVTLDHNNYSGLGQFTYRTTTGGLSTWRTALGACPGEGNDCEATTREATLEQLADLGADQSDRLTDFDGNPIRGLHDIGAYEFTPTNVVGLTPLDQAGSPRIYGDQRFYYLSSTSGTTIPLVVQPSSNDITQYLDLTVTAWTDDTRTWTEVSDSITGPVIHQVCGLSPSSPYRLTTTHTEAIAESITSNASGCYEWSYTGGYSTVAFALTTEVALPTELAVSWDSGCRLSWGLSTGNDGYELEVNGQTTLLAADLSSVSCERVNAIEASNSVRLRAYQRDVYSPWQGPITFSYGAD